MFGQDCLARTTISYNRAKTNGANPADIPKAIAENKKQTPQNLITLPNVLTNAMEC